MNNIIITVGSVTYAIKVKKLLERSGIRSTLVKVDGKKNKKGCTHGIKFQLLYLYDVIAILKSREIDYSVYSENDIS